MWTQRPARSQRGFALIFSLFIMVLLLITTLLLLQNAQGTAANTRANELKNGALNAAEAGANKAMDALDGSLAATGPGSGTLANGYKYSYTIYPNLSNGPQRTYTDPQLGSIVVPSAMAAIVSVGTGPVLERPVTVEEIIQAPVNFNLGSDAILANVDISGHWNHKIGIEESSPGANDANIHANRNVTADVGFLHGTATASGTTDSLNGSPGGVNTSQQFVPLGQFPALIQYMQNHASVTVNGGSLASSYTCPAYVAGVLGRVIFYNGSLHPSGQAKTTFTGDCILVINGDYDQTGQASMAFQASQHSIMLVNGNASYAGNAATSALLWSKGDITLDGNANITGAVVAGGSVSFGGGGSGGGFEYDRSFLNFQVNIPSKIKTAAYAEY
ncbi:MAG: hypothetical protein GIX00_00460 [Candidatus Eremiobacteraeota bacterium]|nr:hypothetical protein [Candidatus Eremiobacteraeota bacterium]